MVSLTSWSQTLLLFSYQLMLFLLFSYLNFTVDFKLYFSQTHSSLIKSLSTSLLLDKLGFSFQFCDLNINLIYFLDFALVLCLSFTPSISINRFHSISICFHHCLNPACFWYLNPHGNSMWYCKTILVSFPIVFVLSVPLHCRHVWLVVFTSFLYHLCIIIANYTIVSSRIVSTIIAIIEFSTTVDLVLPKYSFSQKSFLPFSFVLFFIF